MNVPLGILMVAFAVGLPLWVMLRFPEDEKHAAAHTAVPRTAQRTGPAGRNVYELAATADHYSSAAA